MRHSNRYGLVFLSALVMFLLAGPVFGGHHFSASAVAISRTGGAAVASVALPAVGGRADQVVSAYDDGFVRFSEARVSVKGAIVADVAVTTTETIIVDVWLGDRVHADRVVARTNARQAKDEPEAQIDFDGSAIENLTIDGRRVEVQLDTVYFAVRPTRASFSASHGELQCWAMGSAGCGSEARGILIAGLGRLRIGEVFIKGGSRSIQMLRLERAARPSREIKLSEDDDDPPPIVVVGDNGSNGVPIWP